MPAMFTAPVRRAAGALLAVLAISSAPLPAAVAQESLVRQEISEDAAVALVRERTEGKVVRVDRTQEGGSLVYRVRVITPDGRVREYRVDAATGRVR
jgi:uncharacterized membrane protein YkoI